MYLDAPFQLSDQLDKSTISNSFCAGCAWCVGSLSLTLYHSVYSVVTSRVASYPVVTISKYNYNRALPFYALPANMYTPVNS